MNEIIDSCELETKLVDSHRWATSRWHGLWKVPQVHGDSLKILTAVVGKLAAQFDSPDWNNFLAAIAACDKLNLTMHVELYPMGHSDGVTWNVAAHCDACKFELGSNSGNRCSCCGAVGKMMPQRRRKVRGLRPYLELTGVLGREKTESLWKEFLMHRGPIEPGN
jgi:hypothetical protein